MVRVLGQQIENFGDQQFISAGEFLDRGTLISQGYRSATLSKISWTCFQRLLLHRSFLLLPSVRFAFTGQGLSDLTRKPRPRRTPLPHDGCL